jgi:hypothetical protein
MTNETYNPKQLLELAVLDAHGLLEPIESDLFNRSFHDAPAAIQDEIKLLQEGLALDTSLLPSDMPHPSLRNKVLRAVAESADQEAQRLAPLALIGARASAAQAKFGSSKQITLWRTAAVVLFGVAIVLAVITLDAQSKANQSAKIAQNTSTSNAINEMVGIEFAKYIGNPYCQVTRLERMDGNSTGYLRVAVNERFGNGYVVGIDLEYNEEIIIHGTTAGGEVIELARISGDKPIVGREFAIDPSLVGGMTISAIDAKTGKRWV